MGGPITTVNDIFDGEGQLLAPPFDNAMWERLRRDQLGVTAHDPLGHDIGTASAGRYTPVAPHKQILVGEFDHYGWYNPWFSGDEADFNIHIAPDPAFSFVLTDVRKLMTNPERDLQKAQRRVGFCVECEVTPDEHFYSNEYFPTDEPLDSPLEGRKMGVYGPWVRDGGHGGRPEIHPSEIIWWEGSTNRPGVRFTRYFLVLQDDSNRFDRPGDYNGRILRPWSASPRRANITVALQPQADTINRYALRFIRSRELHAMPNPGDDPIVARRNGQVVVVVDKETGQPETMRVGLSQIAPDPDGRHLRCFLHIGIELGSGDRGDEGYALIRLETS